MTCTINENATIGDIIRKQRRRLGLTMEDLAIQAGLSKPYLSLIETGKVPNPPTEQKLQQLELVLGLPEDDLLRRAVMARIGKLSPRYRELLQQEICGSGEQVDRPPTVTLSPSSLSFAPVPIVNRPGAMLPRTFTGLDFPRRVAIDFIAVPGINDPSAFAARVVGSEMSPTYASGDVVAFSPAATPASGDDCFIVFADGRTMFRRVFFDSDGLRLQPRNEKFPPRIVIDGVRPRLYKAVARVERVA